MTPCPLNSWQRTRLFVSYQRYSALLLIVALGAGALAIALIRSKGLWPLRWAAIVLLLLLTLRVLAFAWTIATRWPRKLRATHLAIRRIESGRWSPRHLERYCEDPCFRVVAREILRHTDLPKGEQRQILRDFKVRAQAPDFIMYVNPSAPQAIQLEGALYNSSTTVRASPENRERVST